MNQAEIDNQLLLIKPLMPPLQDFLPYLEKIWESGILTNSGPVHSEFEKALCKYLNVDHICLFSSGTLALTIALKSLELKGEIITTPFTSVATAQAIYWNNLKPVFVDIDESDFNIDISEIERAITPDTSAILPVHVFGNPCKVKEINKLAHKYNLKVVYDDAHCFGVQLNGESICNFGDMSVLSFHATKVFNSIEGGAIIYHDVITRDYLNALKNTGLGSEYKLAGYGLNAKMNEIQSAFGLAQLKYVDKAIENRKAAALKYRELLKNINGLEMIKEKECVKYNYSYFPVIINPYEFGASRDDIVAYLAHNNIFSKKYFHPLVIDFHEFSIYKTNKLPVAERIADNIICLPLFHDIKSDEISYVVDLLYQINKLGKNI